MHLKSLELSGFKSFAKKETFDFGAPIIAIVGPNGSGKSNIAEAFRFVLGEQSIKSLRGKRGEDLIFSGTAATGRSNRASVKVVFDNTKKLFDVDFEEVELARVVHRDGANDYFINESKVRLRDITELLAKANIGSSGHHIISQGEADRILNANLGERRIMIEDALGLRVYHYKLRESERKLEKTKDNISQVESLRKEIAPHVKFLKKQVEKVEKTKALRDQLKELYKEYLKREELYLDLEKSNIEEKQKEPKQELESLDSKLLKAKDTLERSAKGDEKSKEIIELESQLRSVREEKDTLSRKLGQLEGQIEAEERRAKNERAGERKERSVPLMEVKRITGEIEVYLNEGARASNLEEAQGVIKRISSALRAFIETVEKSFAQHALPEMDDEELWQELKEEKHSLDGEYKDVKEREDELGRKYVALRTTIESSKDENRDAEREIFTIMSRQSELRTILVEVTTIKARVQKENEDFERELEEGAALVGHEVLSFKNHVVKVDQSEDRNEQEKRRRSIERIKIRLEEFGGGSGEDVLKEYQDVAERDEFLAREITDLETSSSSLEELIKELEEKLNVEFKSGIEKINAVFQNLFELMFDGGTASLLVVKEQKRKRHFQSEEELLEEEVEEYEDAEGIDINVALPRKRTKGLVMLSGGERALTSIALLFAMSQVNPPPFLVLDETDAALDEANSKRYSDMIINLSKHSQLILITHNRETMGSANILYGVTMGADGASKLLSVKFDEATAVAK